MCVCMHVSCSADVFPHIGGQWSCLCFTLHGVCMAVCMPMHGVCVYACDG